MTVYLIKLSQPFNKKVFPHPLAFKHCITEMKCIAEVFFFLGHSIYSEPKAAKDSLKISRVDTPRAVCIHFELIIPFMEIVQDVPLLLSDCLPALF